jgi:hypothetical protein
MKNDKTFNGIKKMASDVSNIAFRTQLQAGCMVSKEESGTEKKAANFDHIRRDLGMKPDQQRQRKSDDELRQEYRDAYEKAKKCLFQNDLNSDRAGLTKNECAAVLTLGFGQVTRVSSNSLPELRKSLNIQLEMKPSAEKMPIFWNEIDKMKEDAEALGNLCGSTDESSSLGDPPTSAAGQTEQIEPAPNSEPMLAAISEQANTEEQTEKTKRPRKRRTQQQIRASLEEPFKKAISLFSQHGFENQTEKLKVIDCNAVLTLGFGIRMTGRVGSLRERVDEEIAKGRSDCMFWRSLAAARQRDTGAGASEGPGGETRGRKRIREEVDPLPSSEAPHGMAPSSVNNAMEREISTHGGDTHGRKRSHEEMVRSTTTDPSTPRQREPVASAALDDRRLALKEGEEAAAADDAPQEMMMTAEILHRGGENGGR